jgi:hypothetical protein
MIDMNPNEVAFWDSLNEARADFASYALANGFPIGSTQSDGTVVSPVPWAPPLAIDPVLQAQAQLWAQHMAADNWIDDAIDHTTGLTPGATLTAAGENGTFALYVGQGATDANGALSALLQDLGLADKPHRLGLLSANNNQYLGGIGVAQAADGTLRVAVFADILQGSQQALIGTAPPGSRVFACGISISGYANVQAMPCGRYSMILPGPGEFLVCCGQQAQYVGPNPSNYREDLTGQSNGAILTDPNAFCRYLYACHLERDGSTDAGLGGYWVPELRQNVFTRDQVRQFILCSGEYQTLHPDWLNGFYQDLLGRTVADNERAYWVAQGEPAAAKGIIMSPMGREAPQ